MDVEEEGVGQRPHVVEALLGPRPLGPSDAGLPGDADDAGDERQKHRRRGQTAPRCRRTNFDAR